jgi:RNA polymerase sigma-70 factor (ECF subfamily)
VSVFEGKVLNKQKIERCWSSWSQVLGKKIDVESYYRRYGLMVLRRCRALLHDEEHAADAMQDTFVKVIRYQDTLEKKAPSSLLFRIATNVCLNRIRSNSRRAEEPQEELLKQIADREEPEKQLAGSSLLPGSSPSCTCTTV